LDSCSAPVHCVQEVRDAVGSSVELIVDGGIRRGTDILKAIALGADAVSFARPYLFGLAAFGERGAIQAVKQMRESVERDMILSGIGSLNDLDMSFIRTLKS